MQESYMNNTHFVSEVLYFHLVHVEYCGKIPEKIMHFQFGKRIAEGCLVVDSADSSLMTSSTVIHGH